MPILIPYSQSPGARRFSSIQRYNLAPSQKAANDTVSVVHICNVGLFLCFLFCALLFEALTNPLADRSSLLSPPNNSAGSVKALPVLFGYNNKCSSGNKTAKTYFATY